LAPILFNLYFSAIVSYWRSDCVEVGIEVLSRPGRKLVGDWMVKFRLNVVKVTESQFADDLVLYASSHEKLEFVTARFVRGASRWGLIGSVLRRLKGWLQGSVYKLLMMIHYH